MAHFELALAILLLLLVPFAGKLVRLRIRILRWLKWNRMAELLESNIRVVVLVARILLVAMAILLFILWSEFRQE